jgi:predicted MFS family arabinose efflux permease
MGGVIMAAIIGPVLVTQLAYHFDWHLAFIITATPAFIVAIIIAFFSKEVDREQALSGRTEKTSTWSQFTELLKYRNFKVCLVLQLFVMSASWAGIAFQAIYWVQLGGFTQEQFGLFMTIYGVIGVCYNLFAPRIADKFGRRPTCAGLFFLFVIPYILMFISPSFPVFIVFLILGPIQTFLIQLIQGIIGNESIPAHLRSTNTSILMGVGEFLGAAIIVRALGSLADAFGLPSVFLAAAIAALIGGFISLALKETNPHKKVPSDQTIAAK